MPSTPPCPVQAEEEEAVYEEPPEQESLYEEPPMVGPLSGAGPRNTLLSHTTRGTPDFVTVHYVRIILFRLGAALCEELSGTLCRVGGPALGSIIGVVGWRQPPPSVCEPITRTPGSSSLRPRAGAAARCRL